MTRIFGLCPRCKSRIKINNVERLDGHKILCRDCGYTIRIRNPKKALVRRQSDDEEVFDLDESDLLEDPNPVENEDEFAVAIDEEAELPAYRPLVRRPKPKNRNPEPQGGGASFVAAPESGPRKGKQSPLKIVAVSVGVLIGFGVVSGAVAFLRWGGGASAKFVTPEKYVAIPVGFIPLAGQMPDGWNAKSGGGMQGIPIFLTVSDGGSISVDVRETEGSSRKGKLKKRLLSGQEVNQIGGEPMEGPGQAPAVGGTHGYHKDVVMKNFSNYREDPGRPIETGFGEGLISDFAAEEGLLHTKVKGCRASVVHREHQYSIVCKCPPAQFKDVKPVFEKIVASLNPDEGPGGGR